MAIFHLNAKTISRGTASAKSRHDYINRDGRYAKDKEEVLMSESGNMPAWAVESKLYWDSADLFERGNGRLFKQLEFAIPKELNLDEQKGLVKGFVNTVTSTKGGKLPYSLAIHKGHDKENPHCHLMISERAIDGHDRTAETWFKRANSKEPALGGAKKTTELKPTEWLDTIREEWARQANKSLKLAGHEVEIDHRSLEEQGILDREPSQHLGPIASAMERKGIITERALTVVQGEPHQDQKKLQDLEEAKALKSSISDGVRQAREVFEAEKSRRAQEEARQKARDMQIEQERKRQLEIEKQATRKNRGMIR